MMQMDVTYKRVCMFVTQGMDDVQVRGAATDIFSYLVEYNPSMVREFVMQESQQNDDVSISKKVAGDVHHLASSTLLQLGLVHGSVGHPPDQPDHRTHDLRH